MRNKKIILSIILGLFSIVINAQNTYNNYNVKKEIPLYYNDSEVTYDNNNKPTFIYSLPDKRKATGKAVLILQGSNYSEFSGANEGENWLDFFANQGIAAFLLKYRLPNENPKTSISDVETAMKKIRENASSWNINSNDVGVMGFSASGHLASIIATKGDNDVRPNFQILFYPVITMIDGYANKTAHNSFIGDNGHKKQEKEYSSDMCVNRTTPPAFIALCDDDNVVAPANGVNYYNELYRHDVNASLFVYPIGGHGWGDSTAFPSHIELLLSLKTWLGNI